jgi:hypothetical protein
MLYIRPLQSLTLRLPRSVSAQVWYTEPFIPYLIDFSPVLRIRIRMFLGLLDPDPLVRGMDPNLLSPSKTSKKTLIPTAL